MNAANVRAFQIAAEQPVDAKFQLGRGSIQLTNRRAAMILSEFREVVSAIGALQAALVQKRGPEFIKEKIAHLIKELNDLKYTCDGFGVTFGIDMDAAYQLVHESNMTKAFPDGTFHKDAEGKVIKGPNYREPDLSALVPEVAA